jgi:AcrR family transcriptional regulator
MTRTHDGRLETRANLIEVAAQILSEHGASAVTTRAVAEAAGVQAPTIYRLFGDKDGLLEAVAEYAVNSYMAEKARAAAATDDPVADLRAGWEVNVGFGLANPALYVLLTDPSRAHSPAISVGVENLRTRIRRVAEAGRLRVSERRALELILAAGVGAVLTLLGSAPEDRDPVLADAMYDAVVQTILTDAPALAEETPAAAAVALKAFVPKLEMLSDAERALLTDWLDRATGS